MQQAERQEFETHLGAMFGAWNRVLSADAREGYWKGCAQMPLSDFVRCVGKAIENYTADSTQRLPDVGAIWAMKRSLRASAPVKPESASDGWTGDKWDIAANFHLSAYMRERRQPQRYAPLVNRQPDMAATRERTGCLLRAKHQWADLMRSAGVSVPPQEQREVWANCMAEAEREIDAIAVADNRPKRLS